jgi:hypothetical protein
MTSQNANRRWTDRHALNLAGRVSLDCEIGR